MRYCTLHLAEPDVIFLLLFKDLFFVFFLSHNILTSVLCLLRIPWTWRINNQKRNRKKKKKKKHTLFGYFNCHKELRWRRLELASILALKRNEALVKHTFFSDCIHLDGLCASNAHRHCVKEKHTHHLLIRQFIFMKKKKTFASSYFFLVKCTKFYWCIRFD